MKFFTTSIGRLRLVSFLEGLSLILLVFVAMPLKYGMGQPWLVSVLGAIHGGLFVLFIVSTVQVWIEQRWKLMETTWKVLLACIIPFGTFYIDRKILKPIYDEI